MPGWPFVDWVTQWYEGCGPGVREGDSSIVNLHFVLALRAAAEVERSVGDATMAARWESLGRAVMDAVLARYWDGTSNSMADTPGASASSEHAQVLAILTGLLDEAAEQGCLHALVQGRLPARCSIYFAFYILECYHRHGLADAFFERLAFWRELPRQGFVSLPEQPEPSRSDCHGWGAHPLYHSYASLAGVRPGSPGFRSVRIEPMPGPLTSFALTMPHPKGMISVSFARHGAQVQIDAQLPVGVPGIIAWQGAEHPFSGATSIIVAAAGG